MGSTFPHQFPQPGAVGTSPSPNLVNQAQAPQKLKGPLGASLTAPTPAMQPAPDTPFYGKGLGGGTPLPDLGPNPSLVDMFRFWGKVDQMGRTGDLMR